MPKKAPTFSEFLNEGKKTLTYEELVAMAKEGDPLISSPGRASVTKEGLVILGVNDESSYMPDVRIRIEPDGRLRAWVRDPKRSEGGNEDLDGTFGSKWSSGTVFSKYEDLVEWVYSL